MKRNYKMLVAILISAVLALGSVMIFNYLTNPFGVFRSHNWYSYTMTRNPRTAKIQYISERSYDAYVVGSSGSSAFTVEDLGAASGRHFYHCFYYGADMKDILKTVEYLLAYKNPKEILFPITFSMAEGYDRGEDNLSYKTSDLLDGGPDLLFRLQYLLANVKYGYEKILSESKDTYLPQVFDVFVPETGNYDKRVRDTEDIDNLEKYMQKYPEFSVEKPKLRLTHQEEFFRDLEYIVDACRKKGVTLNVVMYPLFEKSLFAYDPEEVRNFYQRLGEITDYWDFTYSGISKEPRLFYDSGHYRNAVGKMMIAKIYRQPDVYVPASFGRLVKKGEPRLAPKIRDVFQSIYQDVAVEQMSLPVLIYHHFSESEEQNPLVVDDDAFRRHLQWVEEAGFQTVSVEEVADYVLKGLPLPEKSVLITIDDGYESNYSIAFPALKEANAKATIFVIGHSVGQTTYKNTGKFIIPHFGIEEGREMIKSGLITIQSHSMDMHQSAELEAEKEFVRTSALRLEGESEDDYIAHFNRDVEASVRQIEQDFGNPSLAFSYPLGKKDTLTEVLLKEKGFVMTLGVESGDNWIMKGLPQTLLHLNRYNMTNATTREELLHYLDKSKATEEEK